MGKVRVLAEPYLSPQHRTGWIGQDKSKGIRWQDTSNAKSLGEVATQTYPNHKGGDPKFNRAYMNYSKPPPRGGRAGNKTATKLTFVQYD